jgi:DNA-binding XRE family transcriptional regulator
MNIAKLRGEIAEAYKTQIAFAQAIGWHKNKVSKLMTGKYLPNIEEAAEISELLRLTRKEYEDIFCSKNHHMV